MSHHVSMTTQDPTQELQDGVDLADDAKATGAPRTSQPFPRVCEAGPCRHYHRLEIQLDAAEPMATVGSDGVLHQDPPPFYVQTSHYCYPSPGIEMTLGALPVVRCNRWDPIGAEANVVQRRRLAFLQTTEGCEYRSRISAWTAAQPQSDVQTVVDEIASQLKETP